MIATARKTAAKASRLLEVSETASAPAVHSTLPSVMIAIVMSLRTRSWKAALSAVGAPTRIVPAISTPAIRADCVGMISRTARSASIVVGIAISTRSETRAPSQSPCRG
jgi:hypothetical protein